MVYGTNEDMQYIDNTNCYTDVSLIILSLKKGVVAVIDETRPKFWHKRCLGKLLMLGLIPVQKQQ